MGSLAYQLHWERLVLPSTRAFFDAESLLQAVEDSDDAEFVRDTAYETLRLGMVGALFLYHFAEVALERGVLANAANKKDAHQLISAAVCAADGELRPDDHKILGEVADAIKHAELNSPRIVHVPKRDRVIEISHSAPSLYPEAQPAGIPQVLVVTAAGSRSLRALMENVGRGWTVILGVPEIRSD